MFNQEKLEIVFWNWDERNICFDNEDYFDCIHFMSQSIYQSCFCIPWEMGVSLQTFA